jgi:hypothetical protein
MKLLERGSRIFHPAPLPGDITRGPVGQCFDWCMVEAMNNHRYFYVEGIARIHDGDWILHAWLTDKNGLEAFDPTWGTLDNITGTFGPAPARYIGVVMPTESVTAFVRRTGYQGILANYHRSPEFADRCLPALEPSV